MTHEELARRLGLARATITNLLGLLELPADIQDEVRRGQISTGHAKILKGITDPERQLSLCKDIISRGLSVHGTEAHLKQMAQQAQEQIGESGEPRTDNRSEPVEKTAHVQAIEDELRQKFAMRVEIRLRSQDKGQIVLGFESNDDFERLLEALRK